MRLPSGMYLLSTHTRVFCVDTNTRRFFHAKQWDLSVAYRQFKGASLAREVNQLCSFYEKIDVHTYEETRNLVGSSAHPHTQPRTRLIQTVSSLDWPQGQTRPADLYV